MSEPVIANFMVSQEPSKEGEFERLRREHPAIVAEAERVFGDISKAHGWLTKPRTIFDGLAPMQFARSSEGERRVMEILARIEHGIFS